MKEHMGWKPGGSDIWDAALEAALEALKADDPAKEIRKLQSHSYKLGIRRRRLQDRKDAREARHFWRAKSIAELVQPVVWMTREELEALYPPPR